MGLTGITRHPDTHNINVIRAFGIDWHKPETFHLFSEIAQSVITAAKKAGVKRFINVGGAGSLEISPGVQLVDTDSFPEANLESGSNYPF